MGGRIYRAIAYSGLLGAGATLFFDIFGVKQLIVKALPILEAFIPIIALGLVGAAIGVVLSVVGLTPLCEVTRKPLFRVTRRAYARDG